MITFDKIGPYEVNFKDCLTEDGNLNLDAMNQKYKELALSIIASETNPDKELKAQYFDFFCNIAGLRGSAIANFLGVQPAHISQWRSAKNDREISAPAWKLIRLFFFDLFSHDGKLTNPLWLEGERKKA